MVNEILNEEDISTSKESNDQTKTEEVTNKDDQKEEQEMNKEKPSKIPKKTTLKYLIDMGLLITFLSTFITGLIKFPSLLNVFGTNPRKLPMYEISLLHDYGAIIMGFLILSHLLLNRKWIMKMTVKHIKNINKKKLLTRAGILFIFLILIALMFQSPTFQRFVFGPTNSIMIEGVGDFEYNTNEIETSRPDLFNEGSFSIFDILVHINRSGKIRLGYHFDESMNTYIIEEINGKRNWWYEAYYDGGWPENNVFRMDHYPYKEKMYIRMFRVDEAKLNRIYKVFADEIQREEQNGGKIIIPTVMISGDEKDLRFTNVVVKPHNLRNDMFQNGTITAIDVIMTLGDEGLISYDLQWYSSIGTAEVKTYFVDRINEDKSHDRCGFVYEAGSHQFDGFRGNHIHIPSDIRVINSPEYVEYFWICI